MWFSGGKQIHEIEETQVAEDFLGGSGALPKKNWGRSLNLPGAVWTGLPSLTRTQDDPGFCGS